MSKHRGNPNFNDPHGITWREPNLTSRPVPELEERDDLQTPDAPTEPAGPPPRPVVYRRQCPQCRSYRSRYQRRAPLGQDHRCLVCGQLYELRTERPVKK